MKLSLWIILLLAVSSCFVTSCAWMESNKNDEDGIQQEINRLRKFYVNDFKENEAVFEGIKVYRENTEINKKKQICSTSYYYTDTSGKKRIHGMFRMYQNKEIISEAMFSNGKPNYYMIYNFPKETLQILFKDGKPETGVYPSGLHNGELLGMYFKNGVPLKVTLFKKEGTVKEILFDVSKSESRNGQPWNGEFLSIENQKIETYADGKFVSAKDCESIIFVKRVLEYFNKNNNAATVH